MPRFFFLEAIMKKIIAVAAGMIVLCSAAFSQVLTSSGVKNTLSTSFGLPYDRVDNSNRQDVHLYGLLETLQVRFDVDKFTVEGMLNWGALTYWKADGSFGNFTFATHAMGFDISGVGTTRDLFKKPLMTTKLNNFDAIIIDPPRAGAQTQIRNIAKSTVPTVVYISCNPTTWLTDKTILERGGYILQSIIPIDQFVGAAHWEIFSVFKK